MPTTLYRTDPPEKNTRALKVTPGLEISAATHASAGTLGAFVQIAGVTCILTNHHVAFADTEQRIANLKLIVQRKDMMGKLPTGMNEAGYQQLLEMISTKSGPIFHPRYLGGMNPEARVIAGSVGALADEKLDVAICPLVGNVQMSFYVRGKGDGYLIAGITKARRGQIVKKSGALTGVTYGKVEEILKDGRILILSCGPDADRNDQGERFVFDPDASGPISDHGDSGSVWVDVETNEAIGLLHEGGFNNPLKKHYSFAIPMDVLADRFGFAFTRL